MSSCSIWLHMLPCGAEIKYETKSYFFHTDYLDNS